jgi:hypothetical protein
MSSQLPNVGSVVATIGLMFFGGCSTSPQMDYSGVKLLSVSGTITLDGEPLEGAVVTFEEDGTFSFGQTDSGGDYTLQFDTETNGCTPGTKLVRISTTRKITGLNTEEEGGGGETSDEPGQSGDGGSAEKVPACYHKDSKLTVEVSSSKTSFDFDLKADCSTIGPK